MQRSNTLAQIDLVRQKFGLNVEPWSDLPDDLLIIALTKRGFPTISAEQYGFNDYETLEWLGDRVLELIATVAVFDKLVIPRDPRRFYILSKFRQHVVRNTTLFCHMADQGLCSFLQADGSYQSNIKDCADILESVIGALFYYLYYLQDDPTAFDQVSSWYRRQFPINEYLDSLKENPNISREYDFNLDLPLEEGYGICESLRFEPQRLPERTVEVRPLYEREIPTEPQRLNERALVDDDSRSFQRSYDRSGDFRGGEGRGRGGGRGGGGRGGGGRGKRPVVVRRYK